MATGIPAGVGDHPYYYICMIPIDCKIINFSLCLLVCFLITSAYTALKDHHNIFGTSNC